MRPDCAKHIRVQCVRAAKRYTFRFAVFAVKDVCTVRNRAHLAGTEGCSSASNDILLENRCRFAGISKSIGSRAARLAAYGDTASERNAHFSLAPACVLYADYIHRNTEGICKLVCRERRVW